MARIVLFAFLLWNVSYLTYRQIASEVWAKDKQTYVMFPKTTVGQAMYYLWRPLNYADKSLTGRGAHIGPHQ